MHILLILLTILGALFLLYSAYYVVIAFIGLVTKYKPFPETESFHHFAILIPAKNEERRISRLLDSINELDYPRDKVETFVLANGCTDRTEDIAREKGMSVIDCGSHIKYKADAMRKAFEVLRDREDIDAYVILDADNVVDPLFIREMNKGLAAGARLIQGRRRGLNTGTSWLTGCYEIFYAVQSCFFNHPRRVMGRSGALNGSGWVVKKELIGKYGFETVSIIEDLEYTILMNLKGEEVAYCDEALVHDEYTADLRSSLVQRLRWSFGMVQCMKMYTMNLLKTPKCLGILVLNIMPAYMLTFVLYMLTFIIICFCSEQMHDLAIEALGFGLVPPAVGLLISLLGMWLISSIYGLLSLVKSRTNVRENVKGIIWCPFFFLTWVPLILSCLFRKDLEWVNPRK